MDNKSIQKTKYFVKRAFQQNPHYSFNHWSVMYNHSVKMKIIKDADTIALYFDKTLYMLYIEWALANHLNDAIQRKYDKFNNLFFDVSRQLGAPQLKLMKKDWQEFIDAHHNL